MDPRTNACMIVIPCRPGGDASGCTGRLSEVPPVRRILAAGPAAARGSLVAGAARSGKRRRAALVRTTTVFVPAGRTRRARLALSAHGRRQLARRRVLRVRVRFELRAGNRVLQRSTRIVTFRVRGRR